MHLFSLMYGYYFLNLDISESLFAIDHDYKPRGQFLQGDILHLYYFF